MIVGYRASGRLARRRAQAARATAASGLDDLPYQ
jgi:hypothetical protein